MQPSNSDSDKESAAFFLLDERIQRWIWQAGWTELKDIQETSIPLIIKGEQDVIISAATASGKTEAAFFPILTHMLAMADKKVLAVYISPMKALINDQWKRLDQLCDQLDIPVIPWHGDISQARKIRFMKDPRGCLLITPESLEGMLIRYGNSLSNVFGALRYCVIDELHAFIDTERGKQLQSLMNRIEVSIKRRYSRIGLSATLGEMHLAANFLRPGERNNVRMVISEERGSDLKLIIRGYYDILEPRTEKDTSEEVFPGYRGSNGKDTLDGARNISSDLFEALRGKNNLVFPNSRSKVELYSDLLRRECETRGIPNEFWPHHGSLSKAIREETEAAIKAGDRPASAIATSTLELGIDIGAVKSVAQIGPAPSVASMRQRLGRSGRKKGEAAILRCYCLEKEIGSNSPVSDQLREGLVQTIAQVNLLLNGWYESPRTENLHLSTLIQQLLSIIAQYGGVKANEAWNVLCKSGIFPEITPQQFAELLRTLGEKSIISQEADGLLLLGPAGERIVNQYSFLAAFASEDEFRILAQSRVLGTLPISRPVEIGSNIIFAGKRWCVVTCSQEDKTIEVIPALGGKPPVFDGMGGKVHEQVRIEMKRILSGDSQYAFLDKKAVHLLGEARSAFSRMELNDNILIENGKDIQLFSWLSDWANDALALILRGYGLESDREGMILMIHDSSIEKVKGIVSEIKRDLPPAPESLASRVKNKIRDKWDFLLTEQLLNKTYVSRELDVESAWQFIMGI